MTFGFHQQTVVGPTFGPIKLLKGNVGYFAFCGSLATLSIGTTLSN
jgi:hypothetical protein